MRYVYNILTPLARYENLKKLIPILQPHGIQWHLIADDDVPFSLKFEQPWIHYYRCPNRETTFFTRANFAVNWLLDTYPPNEGERFSILNDDDALCPDFFRMIDLHDGEVIIPSMERGNRTPKDVIPERAHGFNKLVACPENVCIGGVSVEQIIISGRLLRQVRLPLHICGDGMMVEFCVKTFGADYAPEATVYFNYLEPGRWDRTD